MTNLYAHAQPDEPTFVYLVIDASPRGSGQIGYAGVDEARAHEYALNTQGVVVELPIAGDYRAEEIR